MRRLWTCLLVFTLAACADREGEAKARMADAARDVAAGRAAEPTSFADAAVRYDAALARVADVRKAYADTAAGALATKPTTYLGPLTLGVLEAVVAPQVRALAEAEGTPLACAGYMAQRVAAPLPRVEALSRVAIAAAKGDDVGLAGRLTDVALNTAAGLPAGSEAQRAAWEAIVPALLAAKDTARARELVLTHGLADAWQALAIALVRSGQAKRAAGMVAHSLGGAPYARAEARAEIATALAKQGDAALAKEMMREAERWARAVPPLARARAGLLLARHQVRQGDVTQAEAWLTGSSALRDADLPGLADLVAAYRQAGHDGKLLVRVHADLAAIEAGTHEPPAVELPWLANLAYLQAKLGEPEPGAFALARARLLAGGLAPDLGGQVDLLLAVTDRLLAVDQPGPARDALGDAITLIGRLPLARRDARLAEAARLAVRAGRGERACALVGQVADPATRAIALAEAAAPGFTPAGGALHALLTPLPRPSNEP